MKAKSQIQWLGFIPGCFLALMIVFSSVPEARAQQITASASLDTNAMLIGDHVGLTLTLSGPSNMAVRWPMIPDTILGNITVIGRGKIDTSFSTDKKTLTLSQALNLTCYDSGFYTIPQITFRYRLEPDTTVREQFSELMMLAVHTVKVDTTVAIKPIHGPLGVPWTFRDFLPWILLFLLIAAIVAGGWWYIKRRKNRQPVLQLKPKVQLPPHEIALQALEMLKNKKLWQSGRVKEYYSELTDILRRYIEDRFQVPALEQTTSEIQDGLASHPMVPAASRDSLIQLLMQADMVKFAKAQPVASENERSLMDAIEFVRQTSGSFEYRNELSS